MVEARRSPVLASAQVIATPAISLAPLGASVRVSLRMHASIATAVSHAGAFPFDNPINTCVVQNGRTIARLGPDEWLVLGSEAEGNLVARELEESFTNHFFSLVDISHRNVGFEVAGAHAREVLNGGCPLDLHDEAFPPHCATRTILGKAEIVLLRPGQDAAYRVECWRSFAPYVYSFLIDVARQFRPAQVFRCGVGLGL